MATQTRFKGLEGETLSQLTIKQNDMIQVRHEVGTANDSDKGLPFSVIQSIPIAVCISAASETNKAATIDNFADFELQNGREVIVYMANANTATNPTLTINGVGLAAMESGIWQAGTFIKCKYVSINVSGSQITRWLVDAGAYNTTTQLNGALGGLKTLLNPENIDGRDLNGVTTPGYYYGGFGNGCQNLPPDTLNCGEAWRGFTLIVINTIGNYAQICIPRSSSAGFMENHIAYRRLEDYVGYWSGWTWL